jgi:hypothetical protein
MEFQYSTIRLLTKSKQLNSLPNSFLNSAIHLINLKIIYTNYVFKFLICILFIDKFKN